MQLDLFKEKLFQRKENKTPHYTDTEILNASKEYAEVRAKLNDRKYPDEYLCICMEELSECIQAISKVMREPSDKDRVYGLMEEVADINVCLGFIKDHFGITEEDLRYAIDVKNEKVINYLNGPAKEELKERGISNE